MTAFVDDTPLDRGVALHCGLVRMSLDRAGRLGACRALAEAAHLVPEAIACGMSWDEVAEVLGVSPGMLETAMQRHDAKARAQLR